MDNKLSLIKGIHPGIMVSRELKRRKISQVNFAQLINEHPQTLGAIINGQRRMNIPLSLKIEKKLGFSEGFLMTLQVFHDIEKEKTKHSKKRHPNLNYIRKALFWDTNINNIDWENNNTAIIKRVFERGNDIEIREIMNFYGKEHIFDILKESSNLLPRAMRKYQEITHTK